MLQQSRASTPPCQPLRLKHQPGAARLCVRAIVEPSLYVCSRVCGSERRRGAIRFSRLNHVCGAQPACSYSCWHMNMAPYVHAGSAPCIWRHPTRPALPLHSSLGLWGLDTCAGCPRSSQPRGRRPGRGAPCRNMMSRRVRKRQKLARPNRAGTSIDWSSGLVGGSPAGALHAEHDEAARAEAPEVGQAHGRAQLAQLALLPGPVRHGAQRVQLRARAPGQG